ncbi:MAG: hypothetical protein YK1309IOTA_1510005 [Marine Group I thaumarchaeote]|nr:MAG: hypothetical protein YK1309IOTA_1510005 [Marine Group I thaumarchaeote]
MLQDNFANPQHKKFYFIRRAFKIGNIVIAIAAILFLAKYFLGI